MDAVITNDKTIYVLPTAGILIVFWSQCYAASVRIKLILHYYKLLADVIFLVKPRD